MTPACITPAAYLPAGIATASLKHIDNATGVSLLDRSLKAQRQGPPLTPLSNVTQCAQLQDCNLPDPAVSRHQRRLELKQAGEGSPDATGR
jgi:hypothetical protein